MVTSWLNKYRYITNNHITPFQLPDDRAQDHWHAWNPVQKLSWYWKTVNELVADQQPDIWLHFEELFRPPYRDLFRMLEALPIGSYNDATIEGMVKQKVNRAPSRFFPPYEQWPRQWQEEFLEIAGPAMERFGYTIPDSLT